MGVGGGGAAAEKGGMGEGWPFVAQSPSAQSLLQMLGEFGLVCTEHGMCMMRCVILGGIGCGVMVVGHAGGGGGDKAGMAEGWPFAQSPSAQSLLQMLGEFGKECA